MTKVVIKKIARKTNLRFRCYALCSNERILLENLQKGILQSLFISKYKTNLDRSTKEKFFLWGKILFKAYLEIITVPLDAEEVPRPLRWNSTIDSFTVSQCWNFFETRKSDLPLLMKALRFKVDEYYILENGCKMLGEEIMLRGLYELVSGENQNSIAENVFGRDFSQQSRGSKFFINHVYSILGDLVLDNLEWWYNSGYLQKSCDAITNKIQRRFQIELDDEEKTVFGFIDCNCLETSRVGGGPCEDGEYAERYDEKVQQAFYNGWKSIHGLKHQTVDTAFGLTADMFGPTSLRRNDLRLMTQSRINPRLRELQIYSPIQLKVFGDSAYPFLSHLFSYYSGANTTSRQKQFNYWLKSVRISIEWNYQVTSNLYRYLKNLQKLKVLGSKKCAKIYIVATILRNCHVCLYGSETSNYFKVIPPTLFEYTRVPIVEENFE